MRKTRATIANILGAFPTGDQVQAFKAFEHTNTHDLITDLINPRFYHYRWAHEHALGPQYKGRFDGKGLYRGKTQLSVRARVIKALMSKTTPESAKKWLRLNHKRWTHKKPSDSDNWRATITPRTTEYGRPAPNKTLEETLQQTKKLTDDQRQELLEDLYANGAISAEELVKVGRTLHIKTVYIFNSFNKLEVPITLHLSKGTAKEKALIDSGAMENFIDQKTADRLKIGARKLENHIRL
jgi:hypothetical protein